MAHIVSDSAVPGYAWITSARPRQRRVFVELPRRKAPLLARPRLSATRKAAGQPLGHRLWGDAEPTTDLCPADRVEGKRRAQRFVHGRLRDATCYRLASSSSVGAGPQSVSSRLVLVRGGRTTGQSILEGREQIDGGASSASSFGGGELACGEPLVTEVLRQPRGTAP